MMMMMPDERKRVMRGFGERLGKGKKGEREETTIIRIDEEGHFCGFGNNSTTKYKQTPQA